MLVCLLSLLSKWLSLWMLGDFLGVLGTQAFVRAPLDGCLLVPFTLWAQVFLQVSGAVGSSVSLTIISPPSFLLLLLELYIYDLLPRQVCFICPCSVV